MKFASRITRTPIPPFDTDQGAEIAEAFADLSPPELVAVLEGTAGCSPPYLKGLMEKEPDWLRAALSGSPEDAFKSAMVVDGETDSACAPLCALPNAASPF